MSTPIPPPLRAAAGLAAAAIDSARKVPQQLVGLPVLAISTALQASLKAQQAYAGLVARGDEVLGQLRGQPDAPPWARFDEDDEGGAAPPRAFDVVPDADLDDLAEAELIADAVATELAAEAVATELAAEAVATELAAEAAVVADALAAEADRVLDPDLDPDVLTVAEAAEVATEFLGVPDLTEADAGGIDVTEVDLDPADLDPAGIDLDGTDLGPSGDGLADVVPIGAADGRRPAGSGTEPGADLPAEGAALAADAAATGAALAAETVVAPGGTEPGDTGLDGYLAVEPPVPGYDGLSIPQLRGRLRSLTVTQVEALLGYERSHRARSPYVTMLENRLTTLRSR